MKKGLAAFFIILSMHIGSTLQAQTIEAEQSFYEQQLAAKNIKKPLDFNLKGKVKQCIEIPVSGKDSILLYFNTDGLLEKQIIGANNLLKTFCFDKQTLKSMRAESLHQSGGQSYFDEKYFDASGYVKKQIYDRISSSDSLHSEAIFTYNEERTRLDITYSYNIDTTSWDVVLNDSFIFTFNEKKQVIQERWLSRHPEALYKSTSTYEYDSLSGNLISATYMDDCALAGGNSCTNHRVSLVYDSRNNIIAKSLADFTVRNALWSSSYSYSAKYNENNDVVEAHSSPKDNGLGAVFINLNLQKKGKKKAAKKETQPQPPIPRFEYEYDKEGNWVKKYVVLGTERNLVAERIIKYYSM